MSQVVLERLVAAEVCANWLWEQPFDLEVFATTPKCTRTWYDRGAGCLWTAFMKAYGARVAGNGEMTLFTFGDRYSFEAGSIMMLDVVSTLVEKAGLLVTKESLGFMGSIVERYDHDREVEALHMIWGLIERLPNKVGSAHEVTLPGGSLCLV